MRSFVFFRFEKRERYREQYGQYCAKQESDFEVSAERIGDESDKCGTCRASDVTCKREHCEKRGADKCAGLRGEVKRSGPHYSYGKAANSAEGAFQRSPWVGRFSQIAGIARSFASLALLLSYIKFSVSDPFRFLSTSL